MTDSPQVGQAMRKVREHRVSRRTFREKRMRRMPNLDRSDPGYSYE